MAQALDFLSQLLWFAGLPAAAIVAIVYFRALNARMLSKLIASTFLFLSVFSFSYVAWASIFFRDGMAPGFEPSVGLEALTRSAQGLLVAVLIGASFAIIGVVVARRGENAGDVT